MSKACGRIAAGRVLHHLELYVSMVPVALTLSQTTAAVFAKLTWEMGFHPVLVFLRSLEA